MDKVILRDKHGRDVRCGDRVSLLDQEQPPITGVLKYDPSFFAYAVLGDDGRRYLLMDNLYTTIDPGDGGFAWKEIEKLP